LAHAAAFPGFRSEDDLLSLPSLILVALPLILQALKLLPPYPLEVQLASVISYQILFCLELDRANSAISPTRFASAGFSEFLPPLEKEISAFSYGGRVGGDSRPRKCVNSSLLLPDTRRRFLTISFSSFPFLSAQD